MSDTPSRQIIAMGGGGFSMEPDNPALDLYVLRQCRSPRPKACFLGTASGDSEGYIARFYEAFSRLPAEPSHLPLIKPVTADPEGFLADKDVIYVGGGNTKNLMALWREWGLVAALRVAWQRGTVLCGVSAGSICWFEQGLTDSIPGTLTPLGCLGFLKGSNCPHYDGEPERRPAYQRLIREGQILSGYAADDGVSLHFKGDALHSVVSSRPGAKAYKVAVECGVLRETELQAALL